ncbi:LamG-like jellyroll fold domain-containing protein [Rhodothermus profundi]|uniref:Por secretion system C-terminal sorting domain-containing protein n=1 Tax=Rhodothermus profundi TaxID=633813 RepID=A0A1M6RS79_9BACT|nr:LamG-like jellyroll fold domain-containing protein [Rhodothermus profundi]SHK35147.1 Por secretion system C-terminal sorting domain-containing protein [Rhodothermus profundi]
MERRARILVWAVLLMSCLRAGAARAQLQALWSGERLRAGQPANLFARWEAQEPFHGVELEVPADWSVHQAWAVRTGRPPVVLRIDTLAQGRFYLQPAQPIREAVMLCITVTPAGSGLAFWQLTPLASADISSKHPVPRPASTQRRPLFVQSADTENPRNYVLEVQTGARPLPVTDSLLHRLDLQHPFTLALWLKSTTRNAVVLSTWSGDEQQSYPLELVLDAAGFLRAYRGRPGLHQALITPRPVADGSWHHIALTYDPLSGWSYLYLDGLAADSLFAPDILPINPPSMLTIGGRLGQRATSFAGYLDMLVLDRRAWSATWIRRIYRQPDPPVEGLRLDFETASFQAEHGLSRRRADLFFFEPLRQLRVLRADEEHVLLSWICTDRQTQAFVVERSTDGRTFTTIAQLPAACEGLPYRFRDPAPPSAPVLYYRIQQKFEDDILYPSAVLKLGLGPVQPSRALLLGNFPNPFQGRTTIQYELHQPMPVRLSIWDLSGHEVRVLIDALQPAGQYTLIFDAADLPSGTYFLRLETPEGVQTHKMILVR